MINAPVRICEPCGTTGDCEHCEGSGMSEAQCGTCGGMGKAFQRIACEDCDGTGSQKAQCKPCKGSGSCDHCLDHQLHCPVCNATVKWTCHEDKGHAHCQDGKMVSRRYPGKRKLPCPWPGGRIVRTGIHRVRADLDDEAWLG